MQEMPNYTLHEAMKIVLSGAEDKIMHAAELADEIYRRRLYLKKDGSKAQYTQIRARCGITRICLKHCRGTVLN